MKFSIKALIFIFLSGVFLSGSISMTHDWGHLTDIVLLLSSLGILFSFVLFKKPTITISKTLLILFLTFIFFTITSSLVNGSLQMLMSSFRYLLVFITLSIIVPNLLKDSTFIITIFSFLFSQLPLLILSFMETNPFSDFSRAYYGIFYNTNSFGLYSGTIFVVIFAFFHSQMGNNKKRLSNIVLLSTLFFTFLLITFSGSRTSVMAIILIIIIIIILHFLKKVFSKKISLRSIGGLFVAIIGFSFIVFIFLQSRFYEIFNERIINKFVRKAESGDVLDRRGEIFTTTFNDAKLFGHGSEYFIQSFGLGAHNSFISILGQYGLLAFTFFVILWIYLMYRSLRYYFLSDNSFSSFPIIIVMFFVLTSMTEIMLMKAVMLLAFIMIGVVVQEKCREIKV